MFKCQKSKIFEHIRKLRFQMKGQAAMEFLMTYGWAILVVLVAIGALAYFGVLSPDNFLPKKCTVSPGLACTDHKATSTQLQVVLRNGMGDDLTSVGVYIPECGGATAATPAGDNTLTNGEQDTYTLACSPAITTSKFTGTLNVTYTSSSGITHSDLGSIITQVEGG